MKKIRIAFDKEEVSRFSGQCVVIDLFRFSCTLACLLERKKQEVRIYGDKFLALDFYKEAPDYELYSEIDMEDVEKFDNSPYKALNFSDIKKKSLIVTNSGSKAVMACVRAKKIFVAGFHNMDKCLNALKENDLDILLVPACIFYNRNHIEDFFAAEIFYESFTKSFIEESRILDIHSTGRVLQLMEFRPSTAKEDLKIILKKGGISALPCVVIRGNYALAVEYL